MARDEDRVLVFGWEHAAGIEPHAERSTVRSQQSDRLGELVAGAAPSELVVSDVALMAERVAEVLPDLRPSIELVLRHVFR